MTVVNDIRGLDLTSPHDLIEKGRSPFAKNFRLYAEDFDSRRIAISTRKGQGEYFPPYNETANVSDTSVTGAANQSIGVLLNQRAMPFTPNATGRLSKLELNIRQGTGLAPITVSVHENSSGLPGVKLAETTILPPAIGAAYAYVPAYFIEAPLLTSGTQYWVYVHVQDDGADGYEWSSNTSTALSKVSNSGIDGLTATAYSLNFKTYLSPNYKSKGGARFAQPGGVNRTLVAYETSMYLIDDITKTATELVSSLNTLATNYYYSFADGKVFWVNGYNNLMAWNGVRPEDSANLVTNGTFEVNTTGWVASGGGGTAIARTTSEFHSGVASLSVTATAGQQTGATFALSVAANKGIKITAWVKGTAANTVAILPVGGTQSSNFTLTGSWQKIEYIPPLTTSAITGVKFLGTTGNFFLDDVELRLNGVEQIIDTELPILTYFTFHKDRAWGVPAADPTKLVFSENPGNPSDQPATNQWYYNWLSVSFVYVPAPKAADAITGIVSFQDVLKIFTTTNKYDLYGTDRGSLSLRQSVGSKGAVSQNSILADESYVYFAAQDGFYRHNGSSDELLSDKVQSEFDGISLQKNITVAKWRRQIRFYYGADGSPVNTDCLLYHTTFEEWQHDTEVYTDRAIFFSDGDDDQRLVEFSSVIPAIFNAEQDYNSMGKAIDFAYHMKNESMGAPAQRKRLLKFFPLIQGVDRGFVINVDMDKDFDDNPVLNRVILTSQGAVWGDFLWGDGTLWGSISKFKPVKLRYPGYAYYWQPRISRKGANNPVFFFGVQYNHKAKRL